MNRGRSSSERAYGPRDKTKVINNLGRARIAGSDLERRVRPLLIWEL